MEKLQWNSIDKKQNGLKYSKNYKSFTLPRKESDEDGKKGGVSMERSNAGTKKSPEGLP